MGRFLSPDQSNDDDTAPSALPYALLENPQTLNLYGYVQNNPLRLIDPDGHATWGDCNDGSGSQCLFGDTLGEASQQNGRTVWWNGSAWDNNDPTKFNDGQVNPGDDGLSFIAMGGVGRIGGAAIRGLLSTGAEATAGGLGAAGEGASQAISRELTAGDLGIRGVLTKLDATLSVDNGVATVRVNMIEGKISNPLSIVSNLEKVAKAAGASELRIEGTLANERLANVLTQRYGMTSMGATDAIVIQLH